uniref:Fizzy- protein n=1 Tax=Sphaerodactylus townsendi TaxID=933632 RepID=A0ACB8F1S7_9SAUR
MNPLLTSLVPWDACFEEVMWEVALQALFFPPPPPLSGQQRIPASEPPFSWQVSTHGYSQNQILVWKYPSLTQVAKLTGHSYRVLYLAMSPDGEAIVTGAGDETLRFWNVFSKTRSTKESVSVLNLFTRIR